MAKVGVGGSVRKGVKRYRDLVTGKTYTIDELVKMRDKYPKRGKARLPKK